MHFPKIEKDRAITYRFRGTARDVRFEFLHNFVVNLLQRRPGFPGRP
jgi:hypothetical protein